jgi:hypothetical protein
MPKVVSITIAGKIDELRFPFTNSILPIQANPNIVIAVEIQIICRAFECGKFMEPNINTKIPNINIDALRASTNVAMLDCNPISFKNEPEFVSKRINKYANNIPVSIVTILKNLIVLCF